jgi:hypothetical protein
VEGAHIWHKRPVVGALAEQHGDAFAHFFGCLIRKGHRQDIERRRAVRGNQVGDPMGQRFGFTGTSTGLNQQRPIYALDGAALFII